nr:DUF2231 domain-containing protein [Methylomarinum sp. Ch1-1]MDP4520878.1 hypothetical protein [Methylomarinum sp. Ch1-1]
MIDYLYDLLANVGYIHPLHPPLTHGPIGAVIVAFLLGIAAKLWPNKNFQQSAYYAVIIAFILYFPTVVLGFLDWQHYYYGAYIYPIRMKIALAAGLLLLLVITLIVGRNPKTPTWIVSTLFPSACSMCWDWAISAVSWSMKVGSRKQANVSLRADKYSSDAVLDVMSTAVILFTRTCRCVRPLSWKVMSNLFDSFEIRDCPMVKKVRCRLLRQKNFPTSTF